MDLCSFTSQMKCAGDARRGGRGGGGSLVPTLSTRCATRGGGGEGVLGRGEGGEGGLGGKGGGGKGGRGGFLVPT